MKLQHSDFLDFRLEVDVGTGRFDFFPSDTRLGNLKRIEENLRIRRRKIIAWCALSEYVNRNDNVTFMTQQIESFDPTLIRP